MTERRKGAVIQVVLIKEVPYQTPFEEVKGLIKGAETEFERRTHELAQNISAQVETYEVISHDWKQSVVNFAKSQDVDIILLDWEEEFHHELIHGTDVHWIMDHAHCDVTIFKDRGLAEVDDLLLTTVEEVYDNIKVRIANSIGYSKRARVTFFQVADPQASMLQKRSVRKYHDLLKRNCICESDSLIIESKDIEEEIIKESKKHDMIILGASRYHRLKDALFGHIEDRVIRKVDCSVLITKHVEKKK